MQAPISLNPSCGTAPGRALLLALGAIGAGVLAGATRWLDLHDGTLALVDDGLVLGRVPVALAGMVLVALVVGAGGALLALRHDQRLRDALRWLTAWARRYPLAAAALLLVIVGGALDWYELFYDPFSKQQGLFIYKLREDAQAWLTFAAAVLAGLAISALWPLGEANTGGEPARLAAMFERRRRRWWLLAIATPVILGTLMCALALDGVPHFSDALTYLMQGRILWSGRLWLDSPRYPELFQHSLFFLVTDGRFYGKYPLGWPAIVGTFDHVGILAAANAVLAGLLALVCGWLGSMLAGRRAGLLAALLVGLSPWVWFHGASLASHVASALAVMVFVGALVWLLRGGKGADAGPQAAWLREGGAALGCGLALGAAVLIRPGDAANFALPAVLVVLYMLVRQPRRWLVLGPLIAVGALVGVGVYLWSNAQTTGNALVSPYKLETRWGQDWNPTPAAMAGRLAFQWAELNSRFPGWGAGGITLAAAGAMALLGQRGGGGTRKKDKTMPSRERLAPPSAWFVLVAGTCVFFVFNTAFGFTNVWWGPRWLLLAAPLLAIFMAVLIDAAIEALDRSDATRCAAQMLLVLVLGGMLMGLAARYPAQFWEHRVLPPHAVSGTVHRHVREMGLHHAIVALPPAGHRAPLDARAGMVHMRAPFEDNAVVYVRAIDNWPAKARAAFPGRVLYEIVPDPAGRSGFALRAVGE